jgi:hypothetical protein
VTNVSPDQAITICEGVCIGDANTYSFGAWASIPTGYSFTFGNTRPPDLPPDTSMGPQESAFDGQIAGVLLPGQEKDFVFGFYTPTEQLSPGWYSFLTQLQIFDATAERTMLTTTTFSGHWEVVACSQFPGGGHMGGCFPTRRRSVR